MLRCRRMNFFDLGYFVFLAVSWPYWLLGPAARNKARAAFANRMGRVPQRDGNQPAVLIHAVSLGEVNATPALVAELSRRSPELRFIITTTTDTGFAQGKKLYGQNPNVLLVRYPLDFSFAVRRFLDALRPSVVVLMELELWPNFLRICRRRGLPVVLINGRITERSFQRYRMIRPFSRAMFRSLAATCAQDQKYARRFIELGAEAAKTQVTGTMKFDTARIADRVDGADELASALGLMADEPAWVCGSTGPGEEEICLEIYRQLLTKFPRLRLVIVPRKPERFGAVAELIEGKGFPLLRRSQMIQCSDDSIQSGPRGQEANQRVILGDTMGELRKFYSLASVVFVGRSLIDQGQRQRGSDMIEPAAVGKPTIVGPFTDNFREVMNAFRAAEAIVEVQTPAELETAVAKLLTVPGELGQRARQVVINNQGATARHAEVIAQLLSDPADQYRTYAARGINS